MFTSLRRTFYSLSARQRTTAHAPSACTVSHVDDISVKPRWGEPDLRELGEAVWEGKERSLPAEHKAGGSIGSAEPPLSRIVIFFFLTSFFFFLAYISVEGPKNSF